MNTTAPSSRSPDIEHDPRWAAVLARDPASDGQFCYSVATTGVYCRPSCPSRHARPEHVRFHASAAAAQAAGFRPCKRCKPEQPPLAAQQAAMITIACRTLESTDPAPSLDTLAQQAGLSPHHFHRVFKALTGVTPKAYALAQRQRRIHRDLAEAPSITAAIHDGGHDASGRYYATARDTIGMTPRRFRAGGRNSEIRFAIGQCSLGAILVAQSERGLCAILLGDDADALLRELQDRFPKAQLIGGDPAFEQWMATVIGFVEAPRLGLDLPLDIRGTAFQQRVWQALREIPPGATASYREIAQRIGAPTSMRAVAQACAANALAVAIPCHRVVRTDGALSGYRWGVARKQALLQREAQPGNP